MRENAVWVALAALATAGMGWLGLYGFGWNDYDNEARPAVDALIHGHLGQFFSLAPVYGGSLLERAPFALAPGLWGGGELAVYRMLALPCLLAAGALGLWLRSRARSQGAGPLAQAVALGLFVANPLTLAALELGHPDELIGGALCVAAVLLASSGRPVWAGLALGAAFANKQWAVIALGPVLLALPARRALCASVAGAVSVALLAPFALFGPSAFETGVRGAASPGSAIFQPWQIWWFLGHHGHVVRGLFGAIKPGYRTAPAWIGPISHPLIVALTLPLTLAAWTRVRHAGRRSRAMVGAAAATPADERRAGLSPRAADALLLLALLLLLRGMLDTWDIVYYPLPFVLALATWETLGPRRVPVLALSSAVAVWAGCRWLPSFASADAQAAFFTAWSVPLALALGGRLFDGRKLLGQLRQHLVPLGRHRHQILDAHAEAS